MLMRVFRSARYRGGIALNRLRRVRSPAKIRRYDRLHLGAGTRHLPGWANLDIEGRGNILWDLRKPLPLKPNSIRFVYTEHFAEHISKDFLRQLFSHCRAVMVPGGVLRVSTPDLKAIVENYTKGEVPSLPEYGWTPGSACQALNEAVRLWGHLFIYDEPELTALLRECGFSDVRRMPFGVSEHPELAGLETRNEDDLILEAVARGDRP